MWDNNNKKEQNIPKAKIYTGEGYIATNTDTERRTQRRSEVLREQEQKKYQSSALQRQQRKQERAREQKRLEEEKLRLAEAEAKKAEATRQRAEIERKKAEEAARRQTEIDLKRAVAEQKKAEEAARKQAEAEQKRLEAEQKRLAAEQKRAEEAARKQAEAEQKRCEAEQRKAAEAARKQAEAEQKRLAAEQKKAEEAARKQAEAEQKRLEIEQKKAAEAARRQAEEEKRQAELERRRAEEARKRAEIEQKKAEEARKKAEAEEQKRIEAARKQKQAEGERRAEEIRKQTETEFRNRKAEDLPRWQILLNERKKKRRRIVLVIVLCLLAGAYSAVAVHYAKYFYKDTTILGIDCSEQTIDQVEQEVSEKLMDYTIKVNSRNDVSETITAEQIGLQYKDDGSISEALRKQYPIIWPIKMLMRKAAVESIAFEYDEDKAIDVINHLQCMDSLKMIQPRDAYMKATDEGFEIEPEVLGTTLVMDKTRNLILSCMTEGKTEVSLEEEECYVNPEIYQDNEELVAKTEQMDALASANIVYNFGSEQMVVNSSVLEGWITQTKNGTYVIDDSYVIDFVEQMADKYETYGKVIEFPSSIGTTEYLYGGDYGWLMDEDVTIRELMNAIESGYRGEMEPVWIERGYTHENHSIGYTYAEICIHEQEMWFYKDGELLVDTPVVTGNPNKDNGTPAGGVWKIDEKERNATLKGEGYSTPVDYWLPFNDNIGIHDLQSRGAFGGDIYLYAGSHGCVNTPYEAVKTIYENIELGTPVIVYE